ncbi:cathepsin L [Trichonephila clavata]|uniref:Cathepsin L n=1 Tax=Trichonephila clavata TaxID=2740835 RepID=A0A8X6ITW0_TRICU|nr:cathepsin L [Trichonephila clavata]
MGTMEADFQESGKCPVLKILEMIMKYLSIVVLVFCAVSLANAYVSELDVIKEEWDAFKLEFSKIYEEIEDTFRMKVFMENKHKIAHHNKLYLTGQKSYSLAMNKFGDLLHHEFVSAMNGFKRNYNASLSSGSTFLSPSNIKLPEKVNWTAEGYVTPIKDQGSCGSCWSFSATGALEGQHFRKTGKLVSLSEQNLVDCSGKYGNEGCNGGLMDQAFDYIKNNHGIDTEESYPYKGKQGRCHYKKQNVGATDTGFVDIPSGDETKLMEAVATVGPVSVAIDASHESFQFYSKGVYDEEECSSQELDHGVLVAGYGTTKSGKDYWLVKNSWGTSWGQLGYIKMARNKENQCGIATQASYPLV